MTAFTVRQATATGKSDPTYGDEYIVNFEEDDREVKLSRKKPVEPGQIEDGTIVDGKYGAYFKKAPYNPKASTPTTGTAATPVSKAPYKRAANSDGQRQGMCINNAANYVNTQGAQQLSYSEWATRVHNYASALYGLGDLTPPEVTNVFA